MDKVLFEMQNMWEVQDKESVDIFIDQLLDRIFLGQVVGIAAGRMGYSLRGFIMRLVHMGVSASFIGDTNVPSIQQNSTVIINSSSGETPTIKIFAQQAKNRGAKVFLITQNPGSKIGKLSDVILKIPTMKSDQVMKTLPEQYSFLLLDYIASVIISKLKMEHDFLKNNHSVFE